MKTKQFLIATGICIAGILILRTFGQERSGAPMATQEYVTIRWAGKERTHLIRPGGKVEFIGLEIQKLPLPDHVDDRTFYLNAAMNGLSKEGYEFAGMTRDEIVMRKAVNR
jgi:hypothetical protein